MGLCPLLHLRHAPPLVFLKLRLSLILIWLLLSPPCLDSSSGAYASIPLVFLYATIIFQRICFVTPCAGTLRSRW